MSVTRISDDELDALRDTSEDMARKCGLPSVTAEVDKPYLLNDVRDSLMAVSDAETHERAVNQFQTAHTMFSEFSERTQKTTLENLFDGFEEWEHCLNHTVGGASRQ